MQADNVDLRVWARQSVQRKRALRPLLRTSRTVFTDVLLTALGGAMIGLLLGFWVVVR